MTSLKATVQGRRLELDVPADWPDGTEVEIHPIMHRDPSEHDLMSPEEITATLAAMDQVQPFEMTDEELAEWESQVHARKEQEKARF